jgi:S-formylglutathione hydrolase FrmB
VPEGGGRGLLVFLHGRGGGPKREDGSLHADFFAALKALGDRAPVVVFPNGGDHSYWHDRGDGRWGRYVLDEVIPEALARGGVLDDRVAIGGISMGGFGAFDLARLRPGRFCAAGGHSPAIWRSAGETAPGAFDDGADFGRHDLVSLAARRARAFSAAELWIDAGRADPFVPGIDVFVANLRRRGVKVISKRPPGGHDGAYWREHWDEYLRFYARALGRCRAVSGSPRGAGSR